MLKRCLQLSLLFVFALPIASAQEETSTDAEYIVEQLITPELFGAVMESLAALMASSIQGEFSKTGQSMSDPAAKLLSEIMAEEMGVLMADRLQDEYVILYDETFSPQALSDYRQFLGTPSGRELVKAQVALTEGATILGERYAESIAADAAAITIEMILSGRFDAGTDKGVRNELRELFSGEEK